MAWIEDNIKCFSRLKQIEAPFLISRTFTSKISKLNSISDRFFSAKEKATVGMKPRKYKMTQNYSKRPILYVKPAWFTW